MTWPPCLKVFVVCLVSTQPSGGILDSFGERRGAPSSSAKRVARPTFKTVGSDGTRISGLSTERVGLRLLRESNCGKPTACRRVETPSPCDRLGVQPSEPRRHRRVVLGTAPVSSKALRCRGVEARRKSRPPCHLRDKRVHRTYHLTSVRNPMAP
jgi:hypothetical protein